MNRMNLKRYRKQENQLVTAIKLSLQTDGFSYYKWGAQQRCKAGDWLVENSGDVYSVDDKSFSNTYTQVSPGRYLKTAPVWATLATESGSIKTKEGATNYQAGDMLVYNTEDQSDGYAMDRHKFDSLYQLDE